MLKQIAFLLLLMCAGLQSHAQDGKIYVAENMTLDQVCPNCEYVAVQLVTIVLKTYAVIDTGLKDGSVVTDASGEKMKMEVMSVMNLFAVGGWEYVDMIPSADGKANRILFKRKK